MIGQIQGIIAEKQAPQLLIMVGGIGYEIDAPMSTFYRLPENGQEVLLYTHFVVREDAHQLYGFYDKDERLLFRNLIKVNGVGPKLALTILSSVSADEFIRHVLENDTGRLINIPGIGKKTAERLIIEMRDRLRDSHKNSPLDSQTKTNSGYKQSSQDAVSALIALGYKPTDASRAVAKVDDGNLSSEEMIRRALREMTIC